MICKLVSGEPGALHREAIPLVQRLRLEVRPWKAVSGRIGGIVIFSEDIAAARQARDELEPIVRERTKNLAAANLEIEF